MKANAVDRKGIGIEAEQRAATLFERAGFRVLQRNYHCRTGELDIVAQRKELLVVAEVRLRTRDGRRHAFSGLQPVVAARIVEAVGARRRAQHASGGR